MTDKVGLGERQTHLVVWISCVAFSLVPLTDTSYGQDDTLVGTTICNIKSGSKPVLTLLWVLISFDIPLVLSVALMVLMYMRMQIKYWNQTSLNSEKRKSAIQTLKWYPCCMCLCWFPNIIASVLVNSELTSFSNSVLIVNITLSIGCSYGICLAVVFFSHSVESRRKWKKLIFGFSDDGDDFSIADDIEEYEAENDMHDNNEADNRRHDSSNLGQSTKAIYHGASISIRSDGDCNILKSLLDSTSDT